MDLALHASTLSKPHEPSLQPNLCHRVCKADSKRKIVLKNLPTLKKIKKADSEPTEKKENKMTMKLNNDNG